MFALFLVFYRQQKTAVTWAWLLVFMFIPVLGFVLYLFFGYGLSQRQKYDVDNQNIEDLKHFKTLYDPNDLLYTDKIQQDKYQHLVNFFYHLNNTPLTHFNDVTLITDGEKKLKQLKHDLEQATSFIHIEYYAFVTDETGQSILDILTRKAAEGVQVCLLYDELGSKGTKKKHFSPLIQAGGKVRTFFTSHQAFLKFRANYHDHRKIIVIDGHTSYIGGFNIANQYVETTEKFGYWRDTHLRIYGPATSLLQHKFFSSWNVSVPEQDKLTHTADYLFKEQPNKHADAKIQLITSAPTDDKQQIKLAFIKLILTAKKRIWIQTPYFIPDDSVIDALRIAKKSGVDVKIMIPNKPDHPFIYRATEYYAQLSMNDGVDIYIYNGGFLHSKTLIMDDFISVVGSANQDIRSYKLNFEASAVVFDSDLNTELTRAFQHDLTQSDQMTQHTIEQMSIWTRFKQKTARLLSPIM